MFSPVCLAAADPLPRDYRRAAHTRNSCARTHSWLHILMKMEHGRAPLFGRYASISFRNITTKEPCEWPLSGYKYVREMGLFPGTRYKITRSPSAMQSALMYCVGRYGYSGMCKHLLCNSDAQEGWKVADVLVLSPHVPDYRSIPRSMPYASHKHPAHPPVSARMHVVRAIGRAVSTGRPKLDAGLEVGVSVSETAGASEQ